jgi:hypothetical protein
VGAIDEILRAPRARQLDAGQPAEQCGGRQMAATTSNRNIGSARTLATLRQKRASALLKPGGRGFGVIGRRSRDRPPHRASALDRAQGRGARGCVSSVHERR